MVMDMQRLLHLLTLLSMLAMFWVSMPSEATACIPASTVNECCSAAKCTPAMTCLCCGKRASNSAVLSSAQAIERYLVVSLVPSKQVLSVPSVWLIDHRRTEPTVLKPLSVKAQQPVKLYLVNRSLLI
jgi:hypothetical protein